MNIYIINIYIINLLSEILFTRYDMHKNLAFCFQIETKKI